MSNSGKDSLVCARNYGNGIRRVILYARVRPRGLPDSLSLSLSIRIWRNGGPQIPRPLSRLAVSQEMTVVGGARSMVTEPIRARCQTFFRPAGYY